MSELRTNAPTPVLIRAIIDLFNNCLASLCTVIVENMAQFLKSTLKPELIHITDLASPLSRVYDITITNLVSKHDKNDYLNSRR